MSIQAVAWALEQDLPARPKLVLVSIANHANHKDGYCWLRADTIGQEAACSPRAVFNFVGDLIRNGYVRKALRKGDDGKQRANDYWILFDRPPVEWTSDRSAADAENEPEEPTAEPDDDPQDIVEPHARGACGETEENASAQPVEKPPGAVGPHAPACRRIDSEEPSKTNPKIESGAADIGTRPPRGYRRTPPEPPKPQGATTDGPAIFVFLGTPAYDAWKAHKRKTVNPAWNCTTVRSGDGRVGWYFPSLFPPSAKPPPDRPLATDEELKQFAETG